MTDPQANPLRQWQGSFGASYIERNRATADVTAEATAVFGRILDAAGVRRQIGSVLEVGANVGINLIGLRAALGEAVSLHALEPNAAACAALRTNADVRLAEVIEADASRIPAADGSFDLVFTNGVLIHIPPDALPQAMREIVRVSRRYVLCSEYFSHAPVEIPYRGESGLLWKRDFGKAYLETCPNLRVVQYGFIWQTEFPHFDNLNWWLFEKVA
ncbi:MAG TPA: pseudaminic acid biosynthesis-associated methylase [Vicinamibacterales bacterium]|nr:pseudaminic acid biosynthesis-associated methylase [Vicinamibacterales bacterium]